MHDTVEKIIKEWERFWETGGHDGKMPMPFEIGVAHACVVNDLNMAKLRIDSLLDEIRQLRNHIKMTDDGDKVLADYILARDNYEAATRKPNSHAPAKQLKHSDNTLLRYRDARENLRLYMENKK